jgi:hypothetical protein
MILIAHNIAYDVHWVTVTFEHWERTSEWYVDVTLFNEELGYCFNICHCLKIYHPTVTENVPVVSKNYVLTWKFIVEFYVLKSVLTSFLILIDCNPKHSVLLSQFDILLGKRKEQKLTYCLQLQSRRQYLFG